MALFLVLAILALLVAAVVALPLMRPGAVPAARARYDAAVYGDQLRELERDVARGLLPESELKSARTEIERRLLASASAAPEQAAAAGTSRGLGVALAVLLVGAAAGTYAYFGSPGVADAPFGATAADRVVESAQTKLDREVAALAAKLKENPNDAAGWEAYARALGNLRDWAGAARAYGRLIALGHTDPGTEAAAGEMVVLAANGVVTPIAEATFRQALAQDPLNPIARFYLALSLAQSGHNQQAITAWTTLAGDISDSAMRKEIARRIASVAKANGLPVPPLPPPATPEAQQAQLAAEHKAMAERLVAQLQAKVAAKPDDAQSWLALGGSYAMLGDQAKAADAYQHAAALKPNDADVLLAEARAEIAGRPQGTAVPATAVAELQQAAGLDPKNAEIQWYLGLIAAGRNDVAGARGYWEKALSLLPPDSANYRTVHAALQSLPAKK